MLRMISNLVMMLDGQEIVIIAFIIFMKIKKLYSTFLIAHTNTDKYDIKVVMEINI